MTTPFETNGLEGVTLHAEKVKPVQFWPTVIDIRENKSKRISSNNLRVVDVQCIFVEQLLWRGRPSAFLIRNTGSPHKKTEVENKILNPLSQTVAGWEKFMPVIPASFSTFASHRLFLTAYGMKLYINDKYIKILKEGEFYPIDKPDLEVDSLEGLQAKDLRGTVLLRHSSEADLRTLLGWIEYKKLPFLDTVICRTEDYQASKNYIKSQFRIIKAAGGLVRKKDNFLLIHRLGKWDLPKGKVERGEKMKEAAVREVKEECGVDARLVEKLCTTWHTYIQEGKRIMKKTVWFTMDCVDDSQMEPQYVENIDHLQWMTALESQKALENSYRSIHGVFESYLRHRKKVG